jgi:hypothetical protein
MPKPAAALPPKPDLEVQQVERERANLAGSMRKLRPLKPLERCGFCGRDKAQVKRLIAEDRVMICDDCIIACQDLCEHQHRTIASHAFPMHRPAIFLCSRADTRRGSAWLQRRGEGIIQMHISRPATWLERGDGRPRLLQRPLEESQRTRCPGNPRLHGSITPDSIVSMHTTRSGQISRPERS